MLRVDIWVESFRCAGILLLQSPGENFAHRQHLKVCHFQPVHVGSKNPISPNVFNRFSKFLPQFEDVEGGHLGWKFHVRRYFTFAIAGWKLCASTTFESLPLSTCTLCQQKSYISKCIQPIFEIFASARRCWGWAFGLKAPGAQVFYFCNGKVKLCASTTLESLPLSTFTLCQQKSYNSKGIQRFSKSLPQLEDVECGHLGWKFQVRTYFTFAMARWKHCVSRTFESLPLSTCTMFQQKSYISNDIRPIFEILASARGVSACAFGCKVSGAQVLYFCNGKVKTLRNDTIWKFATFKLYNVPVKILYPKAIQPTFEIFASARRFWGWPFGWKVSVAQIFYFRNGKVKLCTSTTLEISHFQPVHCASKNPISPKVFNRFSKSLPQLEDVKCGHLGWKFQGRRYFSFAMARWKLCPWTTFESLPLSTCTLCQQKSYISKGIHPIFEIFAPARRFWGWTFAWKVSGAQIVYFWQGENLAHRQHLKVCHIEPVLCASKNPISPKVFNRFSKSLPQLEDCEGGHLGGKFQVRRYFTFAMARWKLSQSTTFESLSLSTCRLCPQKSYISIGIHPIFEIFAPARRFWGWDICVESFRCADCLLLARWVLGASTTFESLPLSTSTMCQQKSYISKGIQLNFEILASARRFGVWPFGCKVSGAQVFYFCNAKVKTLRSDNIWKFATFNLYTVPAKILYLQTYSTDFRNLFLISKILRVVIWVESFRCADILLLQ